MKSLLFSGLLFMCIFSSCNNEDDSNLLDQQSMVSENYQVINVGGKQIEKVDGTLSFKSEAELKEVAKGLITLVQTKAMDGSFTVDKSQINELRKNGFRSIYDIYESAMNEAESYYERPGGYEEFKAKYSCLFFPEEGDDYSAYLPISDKKISMLADVDGNVLIARSIVSLKDITAYKQLVDLGQTPPGGITTKASKGDVVSGTNKISETTVGKNKVWVNSKTGRDGSIPIVCIEVCFRKKNFVGIWYNHNSNTEAALKGGDGLKLYAGKDYQSMTWQQGFSSHDYYYAVKGGIPSVGLPLTIPVEQDVEINHWGTGLLLKLRCSYAPFPF